MLPYTYRRAASYSSSWAYFLGVGGVLVENLGTATMGTVLATTTMVRGCMEHAQALGAAVPTRSTALY